MRRPLDVAMVTLLGACLASLASKGARQAHIIAGVGFVAVAGLHLLLNRRALRLSSSTRA